MSYSFLRHFIRAIHHSPQRDAQVAMYSAYFDASGNKRTPVLTLGGFVSTVSKWDRFEKQWARILKANGVSFFHMTEFASSKGEFADWKGDSERRRNFIDELVGCINVKTNKGFAASVVVPDYDRVNSKHTLAESIGQPLAICGGVCIGAMRKWANRKKLDLARILILIEQGDDDQGELIELAKREGVRVRPLPAEDALAFQAADFAGWKTRITLQNARSPKTTNIQQARDILRSMESLHTIVQTNQVYDKENLLRHCQRVGVPLR